MTFRELLTLTACLVMAVPGPGQVLGPVRTGVGDVAASGREGLALAVDDPPGDGGLVPVATTTLRGGFRLAPAPGEFRGAWLHWEDYLTPEAIARTIARASRARLNALVALANYPHQAMWRSRTIPTNPQVAPGFDPLRELVRQAHAAGIQVHPYLVTLNAGLTKHPGIQPEWYARTADGQRYGGWLNPSHPGVRDFLAALVSELAETGVDGIHYDYIRHEYDSDCGYDDYTRQKFFNEMGWDPLALRGVTGGAGMRLLQTAYQTGEGARLFAEEQRFIANAGYRPPLLPEANLAQLRADTVLVAGNLYSGRVAGPTIDNLLAFVTRGGCCVILDGPEVTTVSQKLAAAIGLAGKGYLDERPATITVLHGPAEVNAGVNRQIQTKLRGNPCPLLGDATLLALLDDGTPLLTTRQYGKGMFAVFNFHVYSGEAGDNPDLQRLFGNVVDWLASTHGIVNTTTTQAGGVRISQAAWDRWRVDEVTRLVQYLTATVRKINPKIITSAAGGTQREDLQRVKRDGYAWLRSNDAQFLCPMAYTTDNAVFKRRLTRELEPVVEPDFRQMLFAGIGVYKLPGATQRWLEQIAIARQMGYKGVCFFAFENLTDALIDALAAGPFAQPAPLPWTQVPIPPAS